MYAIRSYYEQCPSKPLDIFSMGALEFERPDFDKFKCLQIAFRALDEGRCRSLVINSANEVAVEAFLKGRVKFTEIYEIIEKAYDKIETADETSLSDILMLDKRTREFCSELIRKRSI